MTNPSPAFIAACNAHPDVSGEKVELMSVSECWRIGWKYNDAYTEVTMASEWSVSVVALVHTHTLRPGGNVTPLPGAAARLTLIASAPKMLAALKAVVAARGRPARDEYLTDHSFAQALLAHENALDAIEAAEGGSKAGLGET